LSYSNTPDSYFHFVSKMSQVLNDYDDANVPNFINALLNLFIHTYINTFNAEIDEYKNSTAATLLILVICRTRSEIAKRYVTHPFNNFGK